MFDCFKDKEFLNRFFKIALPVMISSFISFLVSFVDNLMVGSISNAAVSGVFAANEVSFIVDLAIFGILEGAGIYVQQFNGAQDEKRLKECFRYKLIISIIFLLVTLPLVYLFGKYLVLLFTHKDTNSGIIYNEAMRYLFVVAISYIPQMFAMMFSTTLREIGKTKYAMYSSLFALGANIVFNFLFIVILKWGVIGAALATIIARFVEMVYLMIICRMRKFSFYKDVYKSFSIEKKLSRRITKKGTALFINEIGFGVGCILQALAFSQRDGVLSSISIVDTISNICQILITGISIGIGVMVGSSLGANEFNKARDENKKLTYLGAYLSLLIGVVLVASSFGIPYLYKEVDLNQKKLATLLIIVYGVTLIPRTIAMSSYFTLRTGGKTLLTFLFDTGLMLTLFIPISWILALCTKLSTFYIYLIVNSLQLPKAIIGIILMKKSGWVRNITHIEEEI